MTHFCMFAYSKFDCRKMNVSYKIVAISIFTAVTVPDVSAQMSVAVNKQMSFGKMFRLETTAE